MTNAVIPNAEDRAFLARREGLSFGEAHPFTVDPKDGSPVLRFASLRCAAMTAADRRTGLWCETEGKGYSASECYLIANERRS